ncbi:endonuclease/exonuclease/phosphatase family protein [Photobacterium kishitanii]|uniref:endonuclease/exonuclease/phosphatase family protein n=1 Tax=Photobacterium kishitanii TaxID=318456 RepID=UPI0007F91136|nr:endonuclease/exonuclease/phosphatase family protein [Photobacterium kishitanii]OBU28964.1 hypothetical protein AYY23_22485 [Photobacterium kishitanii]
MLLYNLRFAWWNVALSPSVKNTKRHLPSDAHSTICHHVNKLLLDKSCDFLALCEVSNADYMYFNEHLDLDIFSILDLTCKVGRTRFDILVIYKKSKIRVTHKHSISKSLTGQTVKAAQLVEVENLNDSKIIYIYLCHWASRLNGDSESRRIAAANLVYTYASNNMELGIDVIVMGDFNDNPYDNSVHKVLKANRCHDAVKKYPTEFFL